MAVPAHCAWQQLIDLDSWAHWGPTVRAARLDDGDRRLSADATGSVQTVLGVWLPFRVENWSEGEATRSWSWHVAGVPATEHVVISRGPASCRVAMGVPWWGVAYLGVVEVALRRIRHRAEADSAAA